MALSMERVLESMELVGDFLMGGAAAGVDVPKDAQKKNNAKGVVLLSESLHDTDPPRRR